ncbi:hypothetical protein AA0121_g12250 [Alternaria tenuissima]|nr:hypothetical protein AA0115_g12001 [Alternaria tenuissima]RYO05935.1 hypothetical protein AA0121_g12250 [Alternaria tenuissima]RYO48263.1 hypothetical protein AA0116_g12699 [Alternaria tenuissima]
MAEWRQFGPIAVLFDAITSATSSPQNRELFLRLQEADAKHRKEPFKPRELVKPVKTRWNSYYDCFDRACELHTALDAYMQLKIEEYQVAAATRRKEPREQPRKFIQEGGMHAKDWATITEYKQLLKPFKEATMLLQGRGASSSHSAIWEVLITFEWLLAQLKSQKERLQSIDYEDPNAPEDHLKTNVNNAHAKLSEYYDKLRDSPIYFAATILHPTYKYTLEDLWKVPDDHNEDIEGPHPFKDWLEQGYQSFSRLWRSHKDKVAAKASRPSSSEGAARPHKRQRVGRALGRDDFLRSSIKAGQKQVASTMDDEYDIWKREAPLAEDDPLARHPINYWLVTRSRYPVLSQLALDIYSIPAASADCERIFSELGDLLSVRRLNMKPELLSALQSIRSWRRIGLKAKHPTNS